MDATAERRPTTTDGRPGLVPLVVPAAVFLAGLDAIGRTEHPDLRPRPCSRRLIPDLEESVNTTLSTVERAGLVFDPSWRSFTSTQGGLVVGHLLAAAAALAGAPPRAVTAHLLGGVAPDTEAVVTAAADRTGRTGSVRSELRQDGGLRAVAQTLTLARPASPGIEHWAPSELPRVEDGEPFELPREYVPVAEHTEIRALGTSRPLAGGTEPRLHAWVRIRRELEPLVQLGVLLDALPPSLFAVRTVPAAMPTVELTAHLAGPAPATGAWVRVDQRTVWCDADVAVDDVELRAVDGSLVARGRQTRRLP